VIPLLPAGFLLPAFVRRWVESLIFRACQDDWELQAAMRRHPSGKKRGAA
jgi:hypothetical protein